MLKRFPAISSVRLRLMLNYFGALVLLVGFFSAAFIWQAGEKATQLGNDESANTAGPLAASDSGKQSRQIEIYYGKTGVLMERWREGLKGMSHGKPLAKLIVVVSLITSAGCFFFATRLPV